MYHSLFLHLLSQRYSSTSLYLAVVITWSIEKRSEKELCNHTLCNLVSLSKNDPSCVRHRSSELLHSTVTATLTVRGENGGLRVWIYVAQVTELASEETRAPLSPSAPTENNISLIANSGANPHSQTAGFQIPAGLHIPNILKPTASF